MIERAILDGILRKLQHGELEVVWPTAPPSTYRGPSPGPAAVLVIRDPHAVRKIALGGPLGFAEGYLDGRWDTPDLVGLLDLLAANLKPAALAGRRVALRPVQRLGHAARANTRWGARRNIRYHYDLGNDFYRLWLDPTMTYSCALFPPEDPADGVDRAAWPNGSGLEAAQRAKWDALLAAVDPRPGERLLEIGSGWGGFAIHAARSRGCRVVGITLSQEQLDHARASAASAGVADAVEFRLQDYRDVAEAFDHVASIEMFEAVGERYWPAFFRAVRGVMRPGGRAGIQVITIDHARFETYRTRPEFIQTYIFPGGMLPSEQVFLRTAAEAGLDSGPPRHMGRSYARTLECWLHSFDSAVEDVRALGFDDRFIRMWRYYLAYCITGFRRDMIDVMQVVLT